MAEPLIGTQALSVVHILHSSGRCCFTARQAVTGTAAEGCSSSL